MMQQTDEMKELISQLGPEHHEELYEAAENFLKDENYIQAMGHFLLAIKADPSVVKAKERFVKFSHTWFLQTYNPFVEEILILCLETEDLDCASLRGIWYTLFLYHPSYSRFFIKNGDFNAPELAKLRDLTPFRKPYFNLGMRKLIIYNREFEKFLMSLRRMLLQDILSSDPVFPAADRLAVAAGLACYCAYNEYIFETDPDEDEKWQGLKQKIEAADKPAPDEVAILACYEPLHHLQSAKRVADLYRNDPDLSQVVKEQIDLAHKLTEISKSIQSITEVDDEVSRKVRGQYEVFPYPRWRHILKPFADPLIYANLLDKPLKVLVAGCGTGHEPAMFATLLPKAQVLAVDLSRASLSYAIHRTGEMGIKNIEFRHGDILKLGVLQEKFDIIYSGGVLHHMQDPVKGWKVLVSLLKDDGFMQIGLYSKIARRHILKAQDFIKEHKYPLDAEGMKTFRREAHRLLDKKVYEGIQMTADYYNLSMLRDLLFHVQEHDLDVPALEKYINDVGLDFIKFHHRTGDVIEKYRKMFPRDPEGHVLRNWHAYEIANPDTFITMYQFWLKKKAN